MTLATERTAVLIPAYQCEDTIAQVVCGVVPFGMPVLVVDDGSTDATAARARGAGAEVLWHATNRGKGAALTTGMRHVAQRGLSHVLTMDGDGQHLGDQIPKLLDASTDDPEALIIGSRILAGHEVAAANLLGNRIANQAVGYATDLTLDDTQSGFRIYPLAGVLPLPFGGAHFEFETTVLIHAARCGIRIRTVPVVTHYPPPAERRSHYRKVVDTVRIIRSVVPLLRRQ